MKFMPTWMPFQNFKWLLGKPTEAPKNTAFDQARGETERLARLARMAGPELPADLERRLEIVSRRREFLKTQIDRLKKNKKRWSQYEPEFVKLTAERGHILTRLGMMP